MKYAVDMVVLTAEEKKGSGGKFRASRELQQGVPQQPKKWGQKKWGRWVGMWE